MSSSANATSLPTFFAPSTLPKDATIIANHAIQAKVRAVLYFTVSSAITGKGITNLHGAQRMVHVLREPAIASSADADFLTARQILQALKTLAARIPEISFGEEDIDQRVETLLQQVSARVTDWRLESGRLLDHADEQLAAYDVSMAELRHKATGEQVDARQSLPAVEREEAWRPALERGMWMARRTAEL